MQFRPAVGGRAAQGSSGRAVPGGHRRADPDMPPRRSVGVRKTA